MKLGAEIEEDYTTWACEEGSTCEGACLGTAQLRRDVRTSGTENPNPLISARRGDLVYVTLVNPADKTIIPDVNLTSPFSLEMPIEGDLNTSEYSLQVGHVNNTQPLVLNSF